MSDLTAFPGSYQGDEATRADRSEMWKEYMGLREEAGISQMRALQTLTEGNPREACVHAILLVGSRLDALTYLISKAKVF